MQSESMSLPTAIRREDPAVYMGVIGCIASTHLTPHFEKAYVVQTTFRKGCTGNTAATPASLNCTHNGSLDLSSMLWEAGAGRLSDSERQELHEKLDSVSISVNRNSSMTVTDEMVFQHLTRSNLEDWPTKEKKCLEMQAENHFKVDATAL